MTRDPQPALSAEPDAEVLASLKFQQAMALAGRSWPEGYEEGDEGNENIDPFEWAAKKGKQE